MIAVAVAHPQNGIQACTNKPINKFIYLSSGMLLGIKTITVNGENTSWLCLNLAVSIPYIHIYLATSFKCHNNPVHVLNNNLDPHLMDVFASSVNLIGKNIRTC